MRLERSLWAAFLIPTLVPELEAGVSTAELLAILLSFSAGALLLWNYARAAKLPTAIWLLFSYLVFSLVALTHDPINYFAAHFAGGLAFTISSAVGACAPARIWRSIIKWLFVLVLTGATLDIVFDLAGWSPATDKQMAGWEAGARGLATGRSLNGMYLAPFMAYMVVAAPSAKWRVLGACALIIVFYHVVVFGQGRGATSLAILGMMAVFLRELRSLPAVLLVLGPFLALLATGFFDEATAPFVDRATSQDLSEVDRIHHARVGERLVRNMNGEEVFFGMNYRKVFIANGGTGMHNAFFDMLTRFGLFAPLPWLVFNAVSLVVAGMLLLRRERRREFHREQTVEAAVVIQMLAASVAAAIFINWRSCVLPGICTGLVLQAFQSGRRAWSHS